MVYSTSFGIGTLINRAMEQGAKTIYISIDNFKTLDMGIGMAQALGFSFKDENFLEIGFGISEIERIKYISFENINTKLLNTEFRFFSKKKEKLTGFSGFAYLNRISLGLNLSQVNEVDKIFRKTSSLIENSIGQKFYNEEYSGVGGIGFTLLSLLNASFRCGIHESIDIIGLEEYIADSDLVVTGDENLDADEDLVSLEILSIANKYKIPVVAISPKFSKIRHSNLNIIPIGNRTMDKSFFKNNMESLLARAGQSLATDYVKNLKTLHKLQ